MLTSDQLKHYEAQSLVNVDTPVTPAQLAAGNAAIDRILAEQPGAEGLPAGHRRAQADVLHPDLLAIMQQPFFEEVAKQVLRADAVEFFQSVILVAPPDPEARPGLTGEHVDISYTRADWDATPRRALCLFFLWMSDMPLQRAAYHYRPGSHLQLADWRQQQAELTGLEPAVKGEPFDKLPKLNFAEPVAATATAGQVGVLTTSAVHSGSNNTDREARRVLVFSMKPKGLAIGLPESQQKARDAWLPKLREALTEGRQHLAVA